MSERGNESSSAGSQSHYWQDVPAEFQEQHESILQLCGAFTGICIAGAAYPLVVCVCILMHGLISKGLPPPQRLADVAGNVSMFVFFGAFFGLIISSISGLLSLVVFSAFNRSMGAPMSTWTTGICAGSLAGYLPTFWVGFSAFEYGGEWTAAMLLCPVLAMTLGILGASWQMSSVRHNRINDRRKSDNSLQVSIHQLVVATTWIAVLFAISNFCDRFTFTVVTLAWIILHIILTSTLKLAYRLYSCKKTWRG